MSSRTAVLLFHSPDTKGIIYHITDFIYRNGGNITDLDQHVDRANETFFMRVEWELKDFSIPPGEIDGAFREVGERFGGQWKIHLTDEKEKIAIFVSRELHCLQELLWRYELGELPMDLRVIISNHLVAEEVAAKYGIPFHYIPKTKDNKPQQEKRELEILRENGVTTVILARYMQILTPRFVNSYPNRIINIHHSFLPAFVGSNPYKQAFDRGVKIIGATSHYVTEELDQGPIIEQDVTRISHRDSLEEIKKKGRDLERIVLARAVSYHLEHRILVYGRKTVIFR